MENTIFPLSSVNKLLLDCLHQDTSRRKAIPEASLSPTDWSAFLVTARRHNVSALLFDRLKTGGTFSVLPEPVQHALRKCYMENAARNLGIFFCLKEILKSFEAEGIPVIALKGAHLAHTVYENISVREMCDIDLMVPTDKLKAADGVLLDLGYIPKSPHDIEFEMENFAHLPQYNRPNSPAIEIHWTITDPNPICDFDEAQFWQETEQFQVQGVDVQGLSVAFLLVHLCTHISYHHDFTLGLRYYYDIAILLNRFGSVMNWRQVLDIAIASDVRRGVYLTLLLSRELLGAKVPDEIFEKLKPSNIDKRIMTIAQQKILEENAIQNFSPVPAEIIERKGVWQKTKGMAQRVFLPRRILARDYGLDPETLSVFLYYPIRLRDLLRRQKTLLWHYARGDNQTKSLAQRTNILQDWLAGK